MKRTEKPWGHEVLLVKTKKYAVKKIYIKPGKRLSFQYHKKKDETIYVVEGDMILIRNAMLSSIHLPRGCFYRIPPKMKHRFMGGSGGCLLIECSTPELSDVVRISDDYRRAK